MCMGPRSYERLDLVSPTSYNHLLYGMFVVCTIFSIYIEL